MAEGGAVGIMGEGNSLGKGRAGLVLGRVGWKKGRGWVILQRVRVVGNVG